MNTTENNKLIAEFMGIKFKDDELYLKELREMKANGIYFEQGHMSSELKYHSSWDWLMPVVEKIDNMRFNVKIDRISCKIVDRLNDVVISSFVCGDPKKKEEIVHKAVVEFIKWYNENK